MAFISILKQFAWRPACLTPNDCQQMRILIHKEILPTSTPDSGGVPLINSTIRWKPSIDNALHRHPPRAMKHCTTIQDRSTSSSKSSGTEGSCIDGLLPPRGWPSRGPADTAYSTSASRDRKPCEMAEHAGSYPKCARRGLARRDLPLYGLEGKESVFCPMAGSAEHATDSDDRSSRKGAGP